MTPDQIAELRKQKYNATVIRLEKAHSDLLMMRIKLDTPLRPHKPGQYTTLGLGYWEPRFPGCQEEPLEPADEGKIVRRSYSIGCGVLDEGLQLLSGYGTDWLEFYIVLVREAEKAPPALTPRLFMLREGDRLHMGEKITGNYTLDSVTRPDDTILFLSTGTGEAPHNYMLWDLLKRGHEGRVLSACCVRLKRDLAYLATQQELMRRYPNYSYMSLTTREPENAGKKVYVQDVLQNGELEKQLGQQLDPSRTHVFLCGNPSMIGVPNKDRETGQLTYPKTLGVIEVLERRGFKADQAHSKERGNIHFEEYW